MEHQLQKQVYSKIFPTKKKLEAYETVTKTIC